MVGDDGRVTTFHPDELPIDATLVRRLVDSAFPTYAEHEVVALPRSGSSNALFRLGDDALVRLPRQPGGGVSLVKEAAWLPSVAAGVSVAVPEILELGEPDLGYPEPWAITSWLPGRRLSPPALAPAPAPLGGDGGQLARDLATFVAEIRSLEVPGRAAGDESLAWYRGLPLWQLDAEFRDAAAQCRALGTALDIDHALDVWGSAVEASRQVERVDTWFHGDLLTENLLVDDSGGLAGVLDFGGLAIGDPTVDLVVAWEALDAAGRHEFRRALHVDDAAWTTGRGWALLIAMITFPYYGQSMPARCAERMAMARAALAG